LRAKNIPKCSASTSGQTDLNFCLAAEYNRLDKELDEQFQKLNKRSDQHPAGIRKSQEAWKKFRKAECSNEVIQSGGSNFPFVHYLCMIEFTRERIRHIKWHLAQDCNGLPASEVGI